MKKGTKGQWMTLTWTLVKKYNRNIPKPIKTCTHTAERWSHSETQEVEFNISSRDLKYTLKSDQHSLK